MYILVFIYSDNEKYAKEKLNEVIEKLQISEILECYIEPYWKFEYMFIASIKTKMNIYPDERILEKVANKWERYSDDILTSDAITDNNINIDNIAMINIILP